MIYSYYLEVILIMFPNLEHFVLPNLLEEIIFKIMIKIFILLFPKCSWSALRHEKIEARPFLSSILSNIELILKNELLILFFSYYFSISLRLMEDECFIIMIESVE